MLHIQSQAMSQHHLSQLAEVLFFSCGHDVLVLCLDVTHTGIQSLISHYISCKFIPSPSLFTALWDKSKPLLALGEVL